MLKTLVRILFIGFLTFAGCTLRNQQNASTPKSGGPAAAVDKSTWVEVTFDGLMVFEKSPADNHYEVGILPPSAGQDHVFQIFVGDQKIPVPVQNTARPVWTLDVVTASGTIKGIDITERAKKPCNRTADTTAVEDLDHVYDFCWIIDLQNDFRQGKPLLQVKQDALVPIISLKNGELYTKTKYDEQQRQDSNKNYVNYGFVAETIALRIKLEEGEQLQLNVPATSTTPPRNVFTLNKDKPFAALLNAPPLESMIQPMSNAESHFHRQYKAYTNVANEDYDIKNKEGGLHPINRRFPPGLEEYLTFTDQDSKANQISLVDRIRLRKFTVPHQACGIVFLGGRKSSLADAGAPN